VQRRAVGSGVVTFARQLGLQLTAKTRVVVGVEVTSVGVLPSSDLPDYFGEASGFIYGSVEGEPSRIVYHVPTGEALRWTSRMVGGTGRVPAAERTLTAVERALMWRMADEHLGELRIALDGLLPEIAVNSFSYSLTRDVAAPEDRMIVVRLSVRRQGGEAVLSLAIPAEPVFRAIGQAPGTQPPAVVAGRLEGHVAATAVEIALRFDDTRVGPDVVLGLKEDDVILLDHPQHRPLTVAVQGNPIARAAVGSNGQRLACVVLDLEEAS
jgi:flagellar motor switch protein FliM